MPAGNWVRKGSEPKKTRATTSATIDDSMIVKIPSTESSRRISSTAKNTPVMGALKVAEMPPAAPQATSTRSRFSGMRTHWPKPDASAAPICTIGPSRPTDPPVPMHSAEARAFTTVTCGRIRPPFSATAIMTSGTPWPRASRANREISGPYSKPPTTGMTTKKPRPSQGRWSLPTQPSWPNSSRPVASQVKP